MASGVKLGKMGSFELNPRGNIWFKDDTTLGHKLLSKMGWSKGKGLGKNEDGITENIKMFKKDNMTGVGYKNDTYISVGCIEYENILKKLQQHFKNEDSFSTANMESLELRSRNSKSRLHYQKFIKGKDLFKCSEKDMKCIFLENPKDLSGSDSINRVNEEINTIKSELSVSDYFAQKMQQKRSFSCKADEVPENVTFEKSHSPLSKKRKLDEVSEVEKEVKLECEEYLNQSSSSPSKRATLNRNNLKERTSNNSKSKKSASKKKKIPKIKNLKSCIKKYDSNGNLFKKRKVVFNDCVSYKILDDSTENANEDNPSIYKEIDEVDCLQSEINANNKEEDNEMLLESNKIISNQLNGESTHLFDDVNKIKAIDNDEENQVQDRTLDQVESSDSEPPCLDLPVCSASNYNCWLESQRTALKMKLYVNMIKKLKKHPVLKTTNILDIKGYGNWGFKL